MSSIDTATKPVDQHSWWRRRLAGEEIATSDGDCEAGFYRSKRKDGSSEAVAVWFAKDGSLRCRVGKQDLTEQRAKEIWPYISKNPVSHDDYKAKLETGTWLGEHPTVTRSNNAPPDDSFEGLSVAIADMAREAEALIKKGAAATQDEADRASDIASRLGEFWTKADMARKVEKKPHDDAAAAVQQKWIPVLDVASIYKRVKLVVVTPFLNAKDAADRKAREDAAKAGAPLPEPVRSTTKAGTRGKTVALRTVKAVEITDRAAVLAYFADGEMMTRALQEWSEKAIRAGVTVPGTKVTESKVAA